MTAPLVQLPTRPRRRVTWAVPDCVSSLIGTFDGAPLAWLLGIHEPGRLGSSQVLELVLRRALSLDGEEVDE